jgi:hypothetical protein
MIERIKELISSNNELLTLGGLIIGLIGIILAIYFFVKSKKLKKKNYQLKSFNLIHESVSDLPDLEVKYKGNEVNNLTITKIAIWNSGNQTINSQDLVDLDPLRIYGSEGIEVFDIEIIDVVESSNDYQLIRENDYWKLVFDYVDPEQGCGIVIYHSGKESSDILISGKLKGQGTIEQNDNVGGNIIEYRMQYSKAPSILKESFILTAKIGWFLYLIASIATLIVSLYKEIYWLLLVTAFCVFATYIMFPKGRIPKKLQIIFSNERKTTANNGYK